MARALVPWLLLACASAQDHFSAEVAKPEVHEETESTDFTKEAEPQKFNVQEMPELAADIMKGVVESFLQKQELPPDEVQCLRDGVKQMASDTLEVGSHVVMFTQELLGLRDSLPKTREIPTTTMNQELLKEEGLLAERRLEDDSPDFLMDASAVVMELGLSMQKVAALSHQILHTCMKEDGLEVLRDAAAHALNVTYVTQRVFINGADVCNELADGVQKWNDEDREGFGRDLGYIMRKLVLSPLQSPQLQAIPSTRILVNITDTFLASFFGPGMALHVQTFEGAKVTDDFRIDLHRCFGENAGLVRKMWASTMEVFRAQAEKRMHKAEGVSSEKENDDLKKTLTYDMMQIPMALDKCQLSRERQEMMKDAFMGLSADSMALMIDTGGRVDDVAVENQLARAVECWRDLKKDGGVSFGHALGKLFQDLASMAFPQKYLVDDLGRLRRRSRNLPVMPLAVGAAALGVPGLLLVLRRKRPVLEDEVEPLTA